MNTITLFSATVTEEVPPRLSVGFHPDSGLNCCGQIGPFKLTDQQECRISLGLGNKKVELENAQSLASDCDFGKYFALKEDSQNIGTYECQVNPHTSFTRNDLSQVTLKVRDAKIIVGFQTVAPAQPAVPASQTPAPAANPIDLDAVRAAFRAAFESRTPPAVPVTQTPAPAQPAAGFTMPNLPRFNPGVTNFTMPSTFMMPSVLIPTDSRLTGCLKDAQGNFKEDCGLESEIERLAYTLVQKDQEKYYGSKDPQEKELHIALRNREKAFDALEKRKAEAANHNEVDGRLVTNRVMSQYLTQGETTNYIQFLDYTASHSLQEWIALDPVENDNLYQSFLAAEKRFILAGGKNR